MKPIFLVFLGLVGAGATYISVTTESDQIAIISGLVGMLSWLLFAFSALSITVYDANGSPTTTRYPAMAVYGVAMSLPNVFVALTGPLEILNDRDQLRKEVL